MLVFEKKIKSGYFHKHLYHYLHILAGRFIKKYTIAIATESCIICNSQIIRVCMYV